MNNGLLPLFPLELVLLPEEALPLHIFEDRYKTMVGECLSAKAEGRGEQEFGVVWLKGAEISTEGCTARILTVTHRYDDGRMDILTIGKRRFEILATDTGRPYLRGAVTFFEDEGLDIPSDKDAELAIGRFREVVQKLRGSREMPIHIPRPYRYLSFQITAALPFHPEFKLQLLATRDEPERLAMVMRALEIFMNQLERLRESEQKANGNGHGRGSN